MNNRNPFIPNIPTAQGGWGDPHQIYTQNHSFNNGSASHVTSSGGSSTGSSLSGQTNIQMQIPFSTHQQVQQQLQGSHGQWYTTQTGASIPLTTLPLQATTGSIFWDDGSSSVNLNSGVQLNYATYQNANSGGYQQQQQQQQQVASSQQSQSAVVHQIVTQQQRVVPLSLDASHFVHFPVNLSPPSGMVSIPLSLNSRSSNSSSPGANMSPIQTRNVSTPMSVNSPSPTSMIEPLQLNVRSSGGSSSNFGNVSNNNPRSNVPSSNHNLHSHFNNNSSSNHNTNSSVSRVSHHQQNNSRISVNNFVANNSPSPPAHHISTPASRNSRSPAAYVGNSPSYSHSSSPAQMNSRGTSSGGMHNNNSSSSNSNKSHQAQSSTGNSSGLAVNPPSYSPGFPSSLNTRFSPAAVQFLTSAAAASMNLTEATLRQQLALNAAASLSAQNFLTNANNLRLQQQQKQNQQQQHQIAPVAHARSSVPVTPLPFHTRVVEESSSSASPSPPPPPPPPKRKRGPAKKRAPKKPVAINPMDSVRPNFMPTFQHQPQNFQSQGHPLPHSQVPVTRPSVISSTPQHSNRLPTQNTTWNSPPLVSSIPLPTMNPFPLVPTPLPNSMHRMTRPPQPHVNRMSTPTKPPNSQSSLGSPVITTGSPRMGNPMLSSTAAVSPPKNSSNFSSPSKSPTKPNNKFTSVLDYAMERAGIPSDPAGLQEDIDNSDVFREDEIMKLVGQIPDQANDLSLLNPLNELKSAEKAKTDSWEQEALKSASQSGLDDLQFELDRFYCPPSPPKAVAADPSAGSSMPGSDSTLTTIGGVLSTTQPPISSSAKKPTGASDSSPQSSQTKPTDSNPNPIKPGAASGDKKKPDSDEDDIEVILVKLSTKKRRLVRRVPNPNNKKPMPEGKGPPPKTGNSGSRPVPGRRPPQNRAASDAISSRIIPAPPRPPQQRQPGKRVTRSTPQSEKPSTSPAFPNGRYVSAAATTTVPIPAPSTRIQSSVSKISDAPVSKSKSANETARKKTGGNAVPVPKIVRVEGGIMMRPGLSVSAPIKVKPTARKSTAPLPKHMKEPSKEFYVPPKSTSARPTRGSSRKIEDMPYSPEPPSKTVSGRLKRGAKVEDDDDDDDFKIIGYPQDPALPSSDQRPPIKMTLSLTESKVMNTTTVSKGGRGKSSKNTTRGSKSMTKSKKKSSSPKHYSPPLSPAGITETRKREGLRPKSSSTKLLDGHESEEELLIVEEYLADSDDSFDPEGEKDEASSESESDPEPEEDEEIEAYKKIVSVVEPEPPEVEPEPNMKVQDDRGEAPTSPVSPEKCPSPSPSLPEPDDNHDIDDVIDSLNSPIHDFVDDLHTQDDDDSMEVEPEPGPFTNMHLNDSESNKPDGWSTVLEDTEEPEPPNPASTVVEEKTISSDSEDEDDEVTVEEIPKPKVFEMPKPQVIVKGTKEDADKAVSDMRNALAQLSKFKIPFFGK